MTIIEAIHSDRDGKVLWYAENIPNIMHTQGQQFILTTLFAGGSIPGSYYVGLDNRSTVNQADTLANLVGEPTSFGYSRQTLSPQSGFTPMFDSANWTVLSNNLLFTATGGNIGPIQNAFLTTGSAMQGFLISTIQLPRSKTINNTETFSFRISLGLGG